MSVAFVGGSYDWTATGPTASPAIPPGTGDGHLMIALAVVSVTVLNAWTLPSGWTQIDEKTTTGGLDRRFLLAYRFANNEPESYDWTNAGGDRTYAAILSFSGVSQTNPFDVTYARADHYVDWQDIASGGPGHNAAAQPITTATDDAVVLLLQNITHNDITATGAPSGYTSRYEQITTNFHGQVYAATKLVTSAGTETPGVYSHTENGTGVCDVDNFTLALRPASIGIPGRHGANRGIMRGTARGIG